MTPLNGPFRASRLMSDALARDAFVGLAVSLVALALGIGLYIQFGMAFWLALVVALSTYIALISVHVVLRRAGRFSALDQEVKSLQDEVRRLNDTAPVAEAPPYAASIARPESIPAKQPVTQAPAPAVAPASAQPIPFEGSDVGEYAEWSAVWRERSAVIEAAENELRAREQSKEDSFERLQSLVKQLAAESGGPKADTPDPDRWMAQPRPAAPQPVAPPQMMPQYQPFIAAVDDIRFRQAAQSVHLPDALARMQQPAAPATPVVDLRIAEAVAAERVDVYLEPIQTLSDRKPQHFEISVRFRDAEGIEIAQDELARIARASGLGASVDAVKLPRVARVAQRVQSRGRPADVLTTLFGDSLADQNFLEQFATEFAAEVPGRIVLSFAQADVRGFGRVHWETLATMAEIGLKFAIEDVTDLDMDFEALKVCNFKFVKLDAQVFLDGLPAAGGSIPSEDICRHFSSLGMALVVGSIDDEWLLAQIHGFGAVFGQGPLFGAPRPVRQDVLSSVRAA